MLRRSSSVKHIADNDYSEGRLYEEVTKLEETTSLNGTVFSDPEFPPTIASLINTREIPPFVVDVQKFTKHTSWKRIPEIHNDNNEDGSSGKPKLITYESIKPTAPKQGGLENCYFLASLSSLSQYPDRIPKLFLSNCNPDYGIYAIRLFSNGSPHEVVVDDFLPIEKPSTSGGNAGRGGGGGQTPKSLEANLPPGATITQKIETNNGDGTTTIQLTIEYPDGRMQVKKQTLDNDVGAYKATELKFSQCLNDNEYWVPILEKAYAKVQGSYAALEAGNHFETIRDLTGAPGYYYMNVQPSHFALMEYYCQQKFPMSCGIDYKYGMNYTHEQLRAKGLVPAHVYSLLAACTVQLGGGGKQEQLLKLRNPWGDAMEWNGDWSPTDSSNKWNSASVKQQILQKGISLEDPNDKDGIFWISFADFSKYFNSWDVNKYYDQHQFSAATPLLHNNSVGYHLVSIHVPEQQQGNNGSYTFGISQCSHRMMPTSAKYKYSSVRAILVKATNPDNTINGCQFIKGVVGESRDEYIEVDSLEAGVYYMLVDVWWDPSSRHLPNKEVSLNCYGTSRVKFDRDVAPTYDIQDVLTEIFSAKVKQQMMTAATATTTTTNDEIVARYRCQPEAQNIHEYHNTQHCLEGYHFHLISNMESSFEIQEDKKFLSLRNAELVKPNNKKTNNKSSPYKLTGRGPDGYSLRVKPGEVRGVFLRVKSSFGMAGPTGKTTLYLADGSTVPERESQQSSITTSGQQQSNLPQTTGAVSTTTNAAIPIILETLHTGGSRRLSMSRKASSRRNSFLGSILPGGKENAPPSDKNEGGGQQPGKRRSSFLKGLGGGGGGGQTGNNTGSVVTSSSPTPPPGQQQQQQNPVAAPKKKKKGFWSRLKSTLTGGSKKKPNKQQLQPPPQQQQQQSPPQVKKPQPIPPPPQEQHKPVVQQPIQQPTLQQQQQPPAAMPAPPVVQPVQQQQQPQQQHREVVATAQPQQYQTRQVIPQQQQNAVAPSPPAVNQTQEISPSSDHRFLPRTPSQQQQYIPRARPKPSDDEERRQATEAEGRRLQEEQRRWEEERPKSVREMREKMLTKLDKERSTKEIVEQKQKEFAREMEASGREDSARTSLADKQNEIMKKLDKNKFNNEKWVKTEQEYQEQRRASMEAERLRQAAGTTATTAAAPPGQKMAIFQNSGRDPAMANAWVYYESTPWGKIGHGDPPVSVATFPGHRWFIVSNGVYAKVFTVGEEAQQTFTI